MRNVQKIDDYRRSSRHQHLFGIIVQRQYLCAKAAEREIRAFVNRFDLLCEH